MMPALELRGIRRRFGTAVAVDGVSLTVPPGLFLTLLGPSGCGKSTILRLVAGFLRPEAGQILVGGRDVTTEVPHRRPVTMVFQDYALFPHMTVAGNVGFGCEMKAMSRAAVASRVAEMLELIRLPDLGRRYPDELSGGQGQRVALARALAPDPVMLLLDEPLSALDLSLRREMQGEIKAIQRQTGKTFVFVTHDQEEAMAMSDLVAVMQGGRIVQAGPPERVYRDPANAFVARFLGAANLLAVTVAPAGSGMLAVQALGIDWLLPAARVTGAVQRGPARLMLRPESLRPAAPDAPRTLVAAVTGRTFLGGRVHLALALPGGAAVVADLPPADAATIGDTACLTAAAEEMALLPPDDDTTS
jgi:spermidine/putrescine transport system ATP-binding protein